MGLLGTTTGSADESTSSARFTAAYHRFSPRVLGYLRSNGVDDPESITNEVFLGLYQTLDRVQGGDNDMRSMIFSIAHARVVDHHRSRARQPSTAEFDPETDPRISPSAEDVASEALGGLGVFAHVNRLNLEQRDSVLLRIVGGLSLEETAQVMEKSVGAVKQLQRRALETLRNSLREEFGHD